MDAVESNKTMTHIYFPTTAIVSLLYVMDTGSATEIAVVGNAGRRGHLAFQGGSSATSRAVVQSAGQRYRLPAALLMQEFEQGGPVMRLLLRYETSRPATKPTAFRSHPNMEA